MRTRTSGGVRGGNREVPAYSILPRLKAVLAADVSALAGQRVLIKDKNLLEAKRVQQ